MRQTLGLSGFIQRATFKHGKVYNYTKVNYINNSTKVDIICVKHGVFKQTPVDHFAGYGCPTCGKERGGAKRKSNTLEFVNRAQKVHNNKYDYSQVVYKKANEKVNIVCSKHGTFQQTPHQHLVGDGCKKCSFKEYTNDSFIKEVNIVHSNKYDYSKTFFKKVGEKITIICPIHGEFSQKAANHLYMKQGCPKCGHISVGNNNLLSPIKYELRVKEQLSSLYQFISSTYTHTNNCSFTAQCLTHGNFSVKNRTVKINLVKCPKCRRSIGEQIIEGFLKEQNIQYINEYSFNDCVYLKKLRFDFYLPKYNMCIEFDGIQHFNKNNSKFANEFDVSVIRDKIKNDYCIKNKINLVRIPYNQNIKEILTHNLNGKK
jgi:hypothetical protein